MREFKTIGQVVHWAEANHKKSTSALAGRMLAAHIRRLWQMLRSKDDHIAGMAKVIEEYRPIKEDVETKDGE